MNWTRTSDKNQNIYLVLFCIQFYNLHFCIQHEAEIYNQTNILILQVKTELKTTKRHMEDVQIIF